MPLPSDIEALDIGCGDGKSTLAIAQKLELDGAVVGIDKNVAKLPTAGPDPNISFHGFDVMDLPNSKLARMTTLLNVLPGLASYAAAFALLKKAAIVSRDFIYVSQVQFDATPHLIRRGFKTYYSDLAANRFQGSSFDYLRMARHLLEDGLIADFALMESERIRDSADPAIHSLQAPGDSGPYEANTHRYKTTDVVFSEPVYKKLHVILCKKPAQLVPISKRMRALDRVDNVIFSTMPL